MNFYYDFLSEQCKKCHGHNLFIVKIQTEKYYDSALVHSFTFIRSIYANKKFSRTAQDLNGNSSTFFCLIKLHEYGAVFF